jgi:hypothetical protein
LCFRKEKGRVDEKPADRLARKAAIIRKSGEEKVFTLSTIYWF